MVTLSDNCVNIFVNAKHKCDLGENFQDQEMHESKKYTTYSWIEYNSNNVSESTHIPHPSKVWEII